MNNSPSSPPVAMTAEQQQLFMQQQQRNYYYYLQQQQQYGMYYGNQQFMANQGQTQQNPQFSTVNVENVHSHPQPVSQTRRKPLQIYDPKTKKAIEIPAEPSTPTVAASAPTTPNPKPTPKPALAMEFYQQVLSKIKEDDSETTSPEKETPPPEATPKPVTESIPVVKETPKPEQTPVVIAPKSEPVVEKPVEAVPDVQEPIPTPPTEDPEPVTETRTEEEVEGPDAQIEPPVHFPWVEVNGRKTYSMKVLRQIKEHVVSWETIPASLKSINLDLVSVRAPDAGIGFRKQKSAFNKPKVLSFGAGAKVTSLPPLVRVEKENRFTPSSLSKDTNFDPIKELLANLNKLSRERFVKLSREIIKIFPKMGSLATLQQAVGSIHEKALNEPKFSDMYADLCAAIVEATTKPSAKHEMYAFYKFVEVNKKDDHYYFTDGDFVSENFPTKMEAERKASHATEFRRLLLLKCQTAFEGETKAEVERLEAVEADLNKQIGALKKAVLGSRYEAERIEIMMKLSDNAHWLKKQRDQIFGNMIFVGELFKKQIVKINIVEYCLLSLTKLEVQGTPTGEDLECCVKMLRTIGKTWDTNKKNDKVFSSIFNLLERMSKDASIEARYRFMCQDVLDLKKNRWIPRVKELKAQKLSAVREQHKMEVAKEKQKTQFNGFNQRGGGSDNRSYRRQAPPPATRKAEVRNPWGKAATNSFLAKAKPTVPKPVAPVKPKLDRDVVISKTKSMLKEYIELESEAELKESWKEISDCEPADFVAGMAECLDNTKAASVSKFAAGVAFVVRDWRARFATAMNGWIDSTLTDVAMDNPSFPKWIGEVLGKSQVSDNMKMSGLKGQDAINKKLVETMLEVEGSKLTLSDF